MVLDQSIRTNRTHARGDLEAQLVRAAEEFGTPLYVLDVAAIDAASTAMTAAFPSDWIRQYSLKANDLPALVRLLADRGWGANVVSAGEWAQARAAGVPNHRISFEGIGKTDAELAAAVASVADGDPLRWVAVESPDEAHQLAALADAAGLGRGDAPRLDVLLRVNPQVEPETLPGLAVGAPASKFGMTEPEVLTLVRSGLDTTGLRVRGVHVHIGSNLADVAAWTEAAVHAVRLLDQVARHAPDADTVDFGGGFPLPAAGPAPDDFRTALADALSAADLQMPARMAIEPGRYLVGAAGWLVGSVLHRRRRSTHGHQLILDIGMTELLRPALYGSRHAMHALTAHGPGMQTAVEGPVCESTDSWGVHELPMLRRGDLVAVADAGAYAASFTSRYNGRPHPAEVELWPGGTLEPGERVPVTRTSPTRPAQHRKKEPHPC
ncbi:MAG TPA: hypothetical protein VFM50_11540 [Nocardioidaceae bacterium]|nr:hypothetical protein [Nocardioidaceae bacterium]